MKRREFIKNTFLTTVIVLNVGCTVDKTTPIETLKTVQEDLFPYVKELGLDSEKYLSLVLIHPKIRDIDKEYLKNGVKWLNEEAIKIYEKKYTKLSSSKRQKVLQKISKTDWGNSWLYDVMNYLFEAILSDPIYQVNKDEKAWKWLNFEGGLPHPKEIYI